MNQCPQCGSELTFKQGFSKKNGKPWKANMCPNRQCGFVEWLKDGQPKPQPQQSSETEYQTKPTATDYVLDKLSSIEVLLANILKAVTPQNEPTSEPAESTEERGSVAGDR
jgi:hypothetical protein